MMLYYQTKFSQKRTSSSEDIEEEPYFDHESTYCDLNFEDSKQFFFPHDSLARDAASPYHVW